MLYDYDYTPSTRFARNPEAALQWDRMCYIARLLSALGAEQGADPDAAASLLSLLDFLPDAQKDLWTSYLAAGESAQAYQSISEYYWSMAEELRNLDPSDEHREIYGLILPERNALALQLFADYCEYGGFERSVGSIESSGDYMADADPAWADEKLMEIVGIFAAY
jgi:hypothetical protein